MSDYRTTTGEALPPPKKKRHRRMRLGLLLALLIVAALVTAGAMIRMERYVSATGFVTTEHYAEVRPPLSGTVAEILVDSGERVERGEVLVRLDSSQEQAGLEEAQAVLRKTEAEVARRRIEIAEKKRALAESISVVRLRLGNTQKKLARLAQLLERGLVSGSAVEDLELEREIAESELKSLQSRDLSLFVHSLLRSEKYGFSYAETLKVQAEHLRFKDRSYRKAQASRLPLKMLIPLVFLILPASILLILGPVILSALSRLG
jgi:multidrug resistance efflux pump